MQPSYTLKRVKTLVFPIKLFASQSVRVTKRGHVFKDPEKTKYMEAVAASARDQWPGEPLNIPLYVEILFMFKHRVLIGIKGTAPDVDNLHKPLLDALAGIVYTMDSRVCGSSCLKVFGPEDGLIMHVSLVQVSPNFQEQIIEASNLL